MIATQSAVATRSARAHTGAKNSGSPKPKIKPKSVATALSKASPNKSSVKPSPQVPSAPTPPKGKKLAATTQEKTVPSDAARPTSKKTAKSTSTSTSTSKPKVTSEQKTSTPKVGKPAIPKSSGNTATKKATKLAAISTAAEPIAATPACIAQDRRVFAGLSAPDLLRMSADEYMASRQIEYFRARLTAELKEISSRLNKDESAWEDYASVSDVIDRASLEEERNAEIRRRDRDQLLLKAIHLSLVRLRDGEYGYCSESGAEIGLPRLLAQPTAQFCLEAQHVAETRQRMRG